MAATRQAQTSRRCAVVAGYRATVLLLNTVGYAALAAVLAFMASIFVSECFLARCKPVTTGEAWIGSVLIVAASVSVAAPLAVVGRLWDRRQLYAVAAAVAAVIAASALIFAWS